MTYDPGEAKAIARLLGKDGLKVVGWVYLWEDGNIGLRHVGRKQDIRFLDRPIGVQTLLSAKLLGDDECVSFVEALPIRHPDAHS